MATSPKDKFEAAVKVIRGLPKNGSFQPSHELMLKFYSYFKQATEGPCQSPKPAFWDLVNKRKWEAWANLGDMRKEDAMLLYVDELKKVSNRVREMYYPPQIVETMPQTEAVTEFLQKLDNFYEMVEDSENHNTLKMIDKPRLNGSVCGNGPSENGTNLSLDEGDEGEVPASFRVTQLLKCDVRWWKDSPGMLAGDNKATNGIRFERNENGGSYKHNGSDDEDDDDDDDERDEYDTKNIQKERTREKPNTGSVSTEEWEPVDDSRLSISHSNSSGESESETEEFCDTSDDPVELCIPVSPQVFASCLPPLAEQTATSTPVSGGKSVHFEATTNIQSCEISDSCVVNASQEEAGTSDLAENSQLEEKLPPGTLSDEVQSGDLDITMCRGGEEHERDRRRRGGGQGSRDGSTAANRGGHSGSAGEAGGSNPGGGGHRDLFPGPGGGGGSRGPGAGGNIGPTDLNEQIVVTLLRLQHDMSGVLNRLSSLEALGKERRKEKDKTMKATKGWWPFPDLSAKSALVVFIWPLLVHCIITYISRRRRKLNM